ncbi:MAG: winged helix-turn-helix domain-containing protein [Desulfovibrionaceae bacterium]|nr:winged helix-turn-helix domain-containing protein [Desulfovibrionaceae bacterium]
MIHRIARQNQIAFNEDERLRTRSLVLEILKKNATSEDRLTQEEIAGIVGCSAGTVNTISQRLRKNPNLTIADLVEKRRGAPSSNFRVIDEASYNTMLEAITNHLPTEFGITSDYWSAPIIKAFLKKQCRINVKVSYIYYFLNKNGVSLRTLPVNTSQA